MFDLISLMFASNMELAIFKTLNRERGIPWGAFGKCRGECQEGDLGEFLWDRLSQK